MGCSKALLLSQKQAHARQLPLGMLQRTRTCPALAPQSCRLHSLAPPMPPRLSPSCPPGHPGPPPRPRRLLLAWPQPRARAWALALAWQVPPAGSWLSAALFVAGLGTVHDEELQCQAHLLTRTAETDMSELSLRSECRRGEPWPCAWQGGQARAGCAGCGKCGGALLRRAHPRGSSSSSGNYPASGSSRSRVRRG